MQCSLKLSGEHALQIFQGQVQKVPMIESPHKDIYIKIFSLLSAFTFNRCYFVSRQWKEFCSSKEACENRFIELVKLNFSLQFTHHVQNIPLNTEFFSSREEFDKGVVKYDERATNDLLSNLQRQNLGSFGAFASTCHTEKIQNRQDLLNIFSKWILTVKPGYDGILRGTFLGCEKFHFEVHCLFLNGSDNMHYTYLPFFFDPEGSDLNEVEIHIKGEESFGRNQHFKSLSIHFDMPPLTWSLKGIGDELSKIFDRHVDNLAATIYTESAALLCFELQNNKEQKN